MAKRTIKRSESAGSVTHKAAKKAACVVRAEIARKITAHVQESTSETVRQVRAGNYTN